MKEIQENMNENEQQLEEKEQELDISNSMKEDSLKDDVRAALPKKKKKAKTRDLEKEKKKYKISGVIAAFAGIMEILAGFAVDNTNSIVIGLTFICLGYFFYNMSKLVDKTKNIY